MNKIKEVRKLKNISQDDLAKALGISRQAVSHYERGEREPKLATWQKLADFFDVDIAYLQGTSDIKKWRDEVDEKKRIDAFQNNSNSLIFSAINDVSALDSDLENTLLTKEDKDYLGQTIANIFETVTVYTEKDAIHNELSLKFSRKLLHSIGSLIFLYTSSLNLEGDNSSLQNDTINDLMKRLDDITNIEYPYELPERFKDSNN